MLAKCGRCGTTVEVAGPGRFQCPGCGTTNQVPESAPVAPLPQTEPIPPIPEEPASRITCRACSFQFIVGSVETAICPNCRDEVAVPGLEDE